MASAPITHAFAFEPRHSPVRLTRTAHAEPSLLPAHLVPAAAPRVSAASIRTKLQAGRGGELAPEERGLLLALLEESCPDSRGAA